jgi:hypothetical protein
MSPTSPRYENTSTSTDGATILKPQQFIAAIECTIADSDPCASGSGSLQQEILCDLAHSLWAVGGKEMSFQSRWASESRLKLLLAN